MITAEVNICNFFLYTLIAVKTLTSISVAAAKIIIICVRLQLHGAIYRPDSFELMLRYCANLKAMRYESTSLTRIVADKSHRVFVA